jgi:hypothetical protein
MTLTKYSPAVYVPLPGSWYNETSIVDVSLQGFSRIPMIFY